MSSFYDFRCAWYVSFSFTFKFALSGRYTTNNIYVSRFLCSISLIICYELNNLPVSFLSDTKHLFQPWKYRQWKSQKIFSYLFSFIPVYLEFHIYLTIWRISRTIIIASASNRRSLYFSYLSRANLSGCIIRCSLGTMLF